MKCKGIIQEDIVNYKKTSMFIIFPTCSFKCGVEECQNSPLAEESVMDIPVTSIIEVYLNNPLPHAIVCGGLEPFDSPEDLRELVKTFRAVTQDDIVIYTGYTEKELQQYETFNYITYYPNIIVKFGRYIPNQESHFDEILGVNLVSDNQYAKKVSKC